MAYEKGEDVLAKTLSKEEKDNLRKVRRQVKEEAIALVKDERDQWKDNLVFITPKVAFNLRNLVKNLRRNYWGVYKKPEDPVTKREKVWVPLTETVVDSHKAYTNVDERHMTFVADNERAIGFLPIIRAYVKNWMRNTFLGEELDKTRLRTAIDGSAVWKTSLVDGDDGKEIERDDVDILNLFFDPTAKSLQDAYRVTERALKYQPEVESMNDWNNVDEVEYVKGLSASGTDRYKTATGEGGRSADVWETWGLIPKWFFTGELEDKESKEEVEGRIVVSGIEGGHEVLHGIWMNEEGGKPYEEVHSEKVPNRWLGRGPAEKVMMLQTWINTIVNIRINRAFVSQLGLFKIRRGRGITPQTLNRLPSSGAILVEDMEDIQQFMMEDVKASSYKEENIVRGWAERVTATFESMTGESVSPAQSATAAALQSQAATGRFSDARKNVGHFLRRWFTRQILPNLKEVISRDETLRITGEMNDIQELDKRVVNHLVYKDVKKLTADGRLVNTADVMRARKKALRKLENMGNTRYTKLVKDIPFEETDIIVHVDNEQINKTVMVDKLMAALNLAPEYKDVIVRKVFDLMGLDSNELRDARRELQARQAPRQQMTQEGRPQMAAEQLQEIMQRSTSPEEGGGAR